MGWKRPGGGSETPGSGEGGFGAVGLGLDRPLEDLGGMKMVIEDNLHYVGTVASMSSISRHKRDCSALSQMRTSLTLTSTSQDSVHTTDYRRSGF